MGKAIVKLVKKVKKLEAILKRRHVVLTNSEDEEPEDQGRIIQDIDDAPLGVSTSSGPVSTGLGVSTGSGPVSSARGQREGKAPMIVEETQAPKRTKEQIQQEEASLAEAIRLQTLEEEETAKQQRKAQVQFEAQHYTEEDWDAIRAKLEANAELTKNVLGKELPEEDFAKKMVELVNQRKKFFAKERAKARNKDMEAYTVKEASIERYGEELQTEILKKQRIDDKDEEKVTEVKEEKPIGYVKIWNKRPEEKLSTENYGVISGLYRKYPLSKDACQVMLKMKLLDVKMNEVCYKLLKMIEKQAGVRK
ncbi:hypothetical protein Tco_0926030 [Tanacetum coccineum]|uniref:Uncharacterized protein n=1 Tax=Tanacetum coccineum TaxID=301880 RepID=A0ABQ5DBK5_9ASTR